jgi:hypothetical protein
VPRRSAITLARAAASPAASGFQWQSASSAFASALDPGSASSSARSMRPSMSSALGRWRYMPARMPVSKESSA